MKRKENRRGQGKSIRVQLMLYMGLFVVLPLCLALMLLNGYLQRVTTENKVNYDFALLAQIKDNADQMIEITNYSASMMITNPGVLENLHSISRSQDSYELYRARTELSAKLSEMESSVLNAVGGKIAVLTGDGYLIGSHNLSKTAIPYEEEDWYQETLENGRKTTFHPSISRFFSEMTSFNLKDYNYLYIGRSILDYSGENLGVILIQLSASRIWGKFTQVMLPSEEGALYIFDETLALQIAYNHKGKTFVRQIQEEKAVWEDNKDKVTHGTMKNGYYYMAAELEHSGNRLVYTVPKKIFLEEHSSISRRILQMILILIGLTVLILNYISRRLSSPLKDVAKRLEVAENGIVVLPEPENSFLEIHKFIGSYNQAEERIQELIKTVKTESHLKEKAHFEMLMSQISPHFIFNTVNSIQVMAKEESALETERALDALGDILHAVYQGSGGMTTVGQEIALLQAYVDIMKLRFGNSFQYYNVVPTELYCYEIPAFTLQPILENAILHGVKNVLAGQIIVSGMEYEKDFVLTVFNNGNTADKAYMDKLLRTPHQNWRTVTGIGLYNVNSRLKLLYGEAYGLIFNEKVKTGFEIWVRIPKRMEEEQGERDEKGSDR